MIFLGILSIFFEKDLPKTEVFCVMKYKKDISTLKIKEIIDYNHLLKVLPILSTIFHDSLSELHKRRIL